MKPQRTKPTNTAKNIVTAVSNAKKEWIALYAERILNCWQNLKTPFGVSQQYIEEIQTQLTNYYDIPEERLFIERSYR